jgi:hypothetical protein
VRTQIEKLHTSMLVDRKRVFENPRNHSVE